jgi:hypothetical protein
MEDAFCWEGDAPSVPSNDMFPGGLTMTGSSIVEGEAVAAMVNGVV